MGWQDGLGPRGTHSRNYAVSPGLESRPSYKVSSWCFTGRVIHQCVCAIPQMDVKLGAPLLAFVGGHEGYHGVLGEE